MNGRLNEHVEPYLKFLWYLNNCGASPTTPSEVSKAILEGTCETFLSNLFELETTGVLQMLKFEFDNRELPAIYKYYMNKYLASKLKVSCIELYFPYFFF